MKSTYKSLLMILISSLIFAQTPNSKSSNNKKISKIEKFKEEKISPIETLFLPYPKNYSIPINVQENVVSLIQGNPALEQRWRDLYQDKTRLKNFLKQFILEKQTELGSKSSVVESEISSKWMTIQTWQQNIAGYEGPIQQIRQNDYQTVRNCVRDLNTKRQYFLEQKNKVQQLYNDLENLYNSSGAYMNNSTKMENLQARKNALDTMQTANSIDKSLNSKINFLNDLIDLKSNHSKLSAPFELLKSVDDNLVVWDKASLDKNSIK